METYLFYEDPNGGFANPDTAGASLSMFMYGSQREFQVLHLMLDLCKVPLQDSFHMDKLFLKIWGLLFPDGKIYPTMRVNKEQLFSLVENKGKEFSALWEDVSMMESMLQFVESAHPCGSIVPPMALKLYKQFIVHVKSVLLGTPANKSLRVVSLSEMQKDKDWEKIDEILKTIKDAEAQFKHYHVE